MVLHIRLGAKFRDLHAKDSNSFRNRLIVETIYQGHVPLARNRRTSEGCPGGALRATRGTAIISLILPPPSYGQSPIAVTLQQGDYRGLVPEGVRKDIGILLYIIYLSNPYFKLLKTLIRKKYNQRKDARIAQRPIRSLSETYQ